MHLHILGICGTFMGGIAALARASGHKVTGCDRNVYPPMSTQLAALGIDLIEGYGADQLALEPDVFVIGNALSRGNPLVEAILDSGRPYESGPDWLARNVLGDRWVLAVAGTHGKSTIASMLAWILANGGLDPGFLIGGIARNFHVSALSTESRFFVSRIEYANPTRFIVDDWLYGPVERALRTAARWAVTIQSGSPNAYLAYVLAVLLLLLALA